MRFDEKNTHILTCLQANCRMSLTDISAEVGLSIDSVRRRIEQMREQRFFFPSIQLRPRHFGYPQIMITHVKLKDYSKKAVTGFIQYLKDHPRVTELFSISGEWDVMLTIMAKDHEDFALVSDEIRNEYGHIINDWSESLTKVVHKFERYSLSDLREYESMNEGRHV